MSDVSAVESVGGSKAVEGQKVFSLGAHTYISEIVDGHAVAVAGDAARFELAGEGLDGLYLCVIEIKKGEDALSLIHILCRSDGFSYYRYHTIIRSGGSG